MNAPSIRRIAAFRRREQGASLLVVVLVLTFVSFLAVLGMHNSEREATTGARSRSTTRALVAADSGLQLVLSRLGQSPADLTGFDIDLLDGANVQSRTRSDVVEQDLSQVGSSRNNDGFGMGMGSGIAFVSRLYLVNTTATAAGSIVELQAKFTRSEVEGVGY